MRETISVPSRFNGPLDSGNGGYASGVVASLLAGAARVSLRRPVPLDTELEVVREGDDAVRVLAGDALVAEAEAAPALAVGVPAPVSPGAARAARARYRGRDDGPFCRCFVCGRAREDALGVFPGVVEGRSVVASTWTPPAWTADDAGHVRPEFVWAVLDCPTYFAMRIEADRPVSVLAQQAARIDVPVVAGEEHVVMAWPVAYAGRKQHAAAAVLSAIGETLAVGRALMVELRP